ncbi:MAG: ABC transporter permease subunit [Rickettsiales bacterium]
MVNKIPFAKIVITLVLLFLYLPIFILVLYSFNESRYVTVWSEFSLKWYREIFHDRELLEATAKSIKIAATSASISVVFGTMAALSLVRFGLFFGRTLFSTILTAPFIIPEVITGFSLLLLFSFIEQVFGIFAERGTTTVILAHTTLGVAYVTVMVQARLANFDMSLEEAALDLGATPLKVFFTITLPIIGKSLIAGWLLAFTLSLDDLVIASFTSGPGSTTLPMLIYSRIKLGISPEINALATIMLSIVFVSIALVYFANIRTKKD